MRKVLIYEHHPLMREGLTGIVAQRGWQVMLMQEEERHLLHELFKKQPDILLFDPTTLNDETLKKLPRVQILCPRMRMLAYAASDSAWYRLLGCKLSVHGYLNKYFGAAELNQALDSLVMSNYFCLRGPEAQKGIETAENNSEQLLHMTPRELSVLRHLSAGLTNKQIAGELQLSEKTVSTYKRNIMLKIHARTLHELMDFARRNGF